MNGNLGALLMLAGVIWLGYSTDWRPWAETYEKVKLDIGSPSAEAEIDPTRWSTNGSQPVTYIDGNRPHIPDPAVLEVLPKVGGAAMQSDFETSHVDGKPRYAHPTRRFVNMDPEKVREPKARLEMGTIDAESWVNAG